MDAPTGTFIMYSAGAGETALDRLPGDDPDKVNSVYTRKLLPLVKTPGLPLHELARQLRLEVHDLAAAVPHVQQPAYYDGLIGKFCLAGCDAVQSVAPPKIASLPPPKKAVPPVETGRSDDLAKRLQQTLTNYGCYQGKVDGIWNKDAEQALALFARENGRELEDLKPTVENIITVEAGISAGCPSMGQETRNKVRAGIDQCVPKSGAIADSW